MSDRIWPICGGRGEQGNDHTCCTRGGQAGFCDRLAAGRVTCRLKRNSARPSRSA